MNAQLASRRASRGFTLLELLVVIFIMLAMTALAVASFTKFMDTERIRLAAGQVDSTIGMAREYAMSKRTKVMVEFDDADKLVGDPPPPPGNKATFVKTDTTTQGTWVGTYGAAGYSISGDTASWPSWATVSVTGNGNYTWKTLGTTTETRALQGASDNSKRLAAQWYQDPSFTISVTVPADNVYQVSLYCLDWDGNNTRTDKIEVLDAADGTTVLDTQTLASFSSGAYMVWNIQGAVKFKVTKMGVWNGVVSGIFIENKQFTSTLQAGRETDPRAVRVLPYRRMYNKTTGGFSWVVDRDDAALKYQELPRNIVYALLPARDDNVIQYDTGGTTRVAKKYHYDLLPDGSCTALAPDKDGWKTYFNTVFLRNLDTGDVAMLYTPPTSGFTRQRFLLGRDEVYSFFKDPTHVSYPLW